MADNNDIKQKINELLGVPSYSSFRKTTRQKIAEGLRMGQHLIGGFMGDTTSRIVAYRDMFKKSGHNIIENSKKKK